MNASEINTDYLVVGAGAAGMAITAATARKRIAKNRDFMVKAPDCN